MELLLNDYTCTLTGRHILKQLTYIPNDFDFKIEDTFNHPVEFVIRKYLNSNYFIGNCFKLLWNLARHEIVISEIDNEIANAYCYLVFFIKNEGEEYDCVPPWVYELKVLLANRIDNQKLIELYNLIETIEMFQLIEAIDLIDIL